MAREPGEIKRGDYVVAKRLLKMSDVKMGNYIGKIEGRVVSLGKKSDGDERHFILEYGAEGDIKRQVPVRYSCRELFEVTEESDDE